MTNQNDRNFDQQQPTSTDTADQSKKSPAPPSGQVQPNQQDPLKKTPVYESGTPKRQDTSKKDSSQADDSPSRENEGSGQGEKRRAS
jgi:hypothetical protein